MEIYHIMCTSKILTYLKTKIKIKKYFCKSCFNSKNVLNNHKKVSLSINGTQSVRLEKKNN